MLGPKNISPHFFRNPLGIIGLFVSLIYGMAALLFGAAVDKLEASNQTILVLFLVLFPPTIFFAFVWLVAAHHKKLYGPSDFREDRSFLDIISQGYPTSYPPVSSDELDEEAGEDASVPRTDPPQDTPPEDFSSHTTALSPKSLMVNEALLAESLISQKLQQELGGTVRTNVAFRVGHGRSEVMSADLMLRTDDGVEWIVEVKLMRGLHLDRRFRELRAQLTLIAESLRKSAAPYKLMAVAVLNDTHSDSPAHIDRSQQEFQSMLFAREGIELRVYRLSELIEELANAQNP